LIGLDVEPAGLSEIVENREIFLVLVGLLPPTALPRGKAGTKLNELTNKSASLENLKMSGEL